MDPRFILLDALVSLAKGHLLYRGGETSYGVYLAGVPFIALIQDDLFAHGWLSDTDGAGHRFTLSLQGRQALREGAAWYRALPFWRRAINPRPSLPKVCPPPPAAHPA